MRGLDVLIRSVAPRGHILQCLLSRAILVTHEDPDYGGRCCCRQGCRSTTSTTKSKHEYQPTRIRLRDVPLEGDSSSSFLAPGFFSVELLTTQCWPSSRRFRGPGARNVVRALHISSKYRDDPMLNLRLRPPNQFATRDAPLVAVPAVEIVLEETSCIRSLESGWTSVIWSIPARVREVRSNDSSVKLSTSSSGVLDYCNFRPRSSMHHRRTDNNRRLRCARWCSSLRFLDPQSLHPPREESRVWASSLRN